MSDLLAGKGRLWVYCPQASQGALSLLTALKQQGLRVLRLRGLAPRRGFLKGDKVICWGNHHPGVPEGVTLLLNNPPLIGKLTELQLLAKEGVSVPPHRAGIVEGWLGRTSNHHEGDDLLYPIDPRTISFSTQKLDVVREFRVHVLGGKSIRVGERRPRQENHHPWIRSHQAGWGIYYDAAAHEGFRGKGRELAKKAVDVLQLPFAAVDLWLLADGTWVIGEVNRRPGIEGNTVAKYVEKVLELLVQE